jgi:hypothetical protein
MIEMKNVVETLHYKECPICGQRFHPSNTDLIADHIKMHEDEAKPKTKYYEVQVHVDLFNMKFEAKNCAHQAEGIDVQFFVPQGDLFTPNSMDVYTYDDGGIEKIEHCAVFFVKVPDLSNESKIRAIQVVQNEVVSTLEKIKNLFNDFASVAIANVNLYGHF